jgi:hypothetical protein
MAGLVDDIVRVTGRTKAQARKLLERMMGAAFRAETVRAADDIPMTPGEIFSSVIKKGPAKLPKKGYGYGKWPLREMGGQEFLQGMKEGMTHVQHQWLDPVLRN